MDYKRSYVLMWVGVIAGVILVLVGAALELGWLFALGLVTFAAMVLQTLFFFHCPSCGGLWDTRGGIPRLCGSPVPRRAVFSNRSASVGSTPHSGKAAS